MELTTKRPFEIEFSAGIPERNERENRGDVFIYPEEIIGKTCSECVRFTSNDDGFYHGEDVDSAGHHCSMRGWHLSIEADHKACVSYWDKAEHIRAGQEHEDAVERRRAELWAIYAEREPIKLPIVNDGYGTIPMCPVCGEIPYDTEQCHWCGQRFIQDQELAEYTTPNLRDYTCPFCGAPGKVVISKYNGHKHFRCEKCGGSFME